MLWIRWEEAWSGGVSSTLSPDHNDVDNDDDGGGGGDDDDDPLVTKGAMTMISTMISTFTTLMR